MTDQIATSPRPDASKTHKHAQAEYGRSAALVLVRGSFGLALLTRLRCHWPCVH
jgi:hypothetical protein